MRKNKSTVLTVIIGVLIIVLIGGLLLSLFRLNKGDSGENNEGIGGFIDNLISFQVECNGQSFKPDSENVIELPENGQVKFSVKNSRGYTVEVIPNIDFNFTVGGERISFKSEEDFTDYFLSSKDVKNDSFTLNCTPNKFAVQTILDDKYGFKANVVIPDVTNENCFALVIVSSAGERITIAFNQVISEVTILLPTEDIVF